jgi:hypothetical protein
MIRLSGTDGTWHRVGADPPGSAREGDAVLLCMSWKARAMDGPALNRLLDVFGKTEAVLAEHEGLKRVCWYAMADGSGGFTVFDVIDPDAAAAVAFESAVAYNEFLEIDVCPVLDMDAALPALAKGIAHKTA